MRDVTCLLALISALCWVWYWVSYCWALWVIYCLLVLLAALLCCLCCWRAAAIFWSLSYFFLSPSGLGTVTFSPAITTQIYWLINIDKINRIFESNLLYLHGMLFYLYDFLGHFVHDNYLNQGRNITIEEIILMDLGILF